MKKNFFGLTLCALLVAFGVPVKAQQRGKVARIGFLDGSNWTGNGEDDAQRRDDSEESAVCKDISALLDAATFDSATFDTLYDRILACFEENGSSETDHGLANLALLDLHTNRGYKNAVFPIKRRHILELDKAGMFVPLCTTNVFLKYYSDKIANMMFWTENDRKTYFDAIVDTLVGFFAPENGGNA